MRNVPLYEYQCRGCGHQFEALVRPPETPACPSCKSQDLERLLSMFAVNSEERSRSAVRAARQQLANSKNHRDKKIHEQEVVREHIHEHYPKEE